MVRSHERGDIRRSAGLAAAEVARGAFAQELREPRLVLDLLVEDRGADGVGAVVFALRERADDAVGWDDAALGLDQESDKFFQRRAGRRLAALEAIRQEGVRAAGDV